MINQIGLIAIVAMGLTLLIPGTHVEAKSSHHQSNLHKTGGIGLGIGAIAKFKQHKQNPTQIHLGKGGLGYLLEALTVCPSSTVMLNS
jgi:hypothetical protein